MSLKILNKNLETSHMQGYTLLDSGNGRKLEQFGQVVLDRPEERAIWRPVLDKSIWEEANALFIQNQKGGGGRWEINQPFTSPFEQKYKSLSYLVEVDQSRQVGIFPENAAHWDWISEKMENSLAPARVLNLFGYTGMSSLAAAAAGATVTHVDSSKHAIRLGQENQRLTGLEDASIRWLVDDALKFAEREFRRGSQYDGLIMDPPKYGLGPKKERWEFETLFSVLCSSCAKILSDNPRFVVVTAYSLQSSAEILIPGVSQLISNKNGILEIGELVMVEESAGRKIPLSIYARWASR
ncbi:MAG: class I SAM-dependent methyltransferase [Anaerolineales bacterium]|nr:class I SAM-dependent methyltransferase [Anaerolineales bacterium]